MRVCIIAEGCYPYAVGGVSGWINSMIKAFPNVEFIVMAIVSDRSQRGKFKLELPENVTAVYETYLNDYDWEKKSKVTRKIKLTPKQRTALRNLIMNNDIDWDTLFDLFQNHKFSVDDLLMGEDFLEAVRDVYNKNYSLIVFSDFLWTMRSIYLPFFLILKTKLPKANIYHCVATGYAGVLGGMAKYKDECGLLVSEHGIYTREREEEIIKAAWVSGVYKDIWIDQFRKMSRLAYDKADKVTSLYDHARELQIENGCDPGKAVVIGNGIYIDRFADIPGKTEAETESGVVNVGAILRVAPIKDVKTLIQAFSYAKQKVPKLHLWIMGPLDEDAEYAEECIKMVELLGVKDVHFTGTVDTRDYIGRMDFTILTSISEGQPLTILEGFAAGKPAIATDVGNCRDMIYGPNDDFGQAGIVTHIMNIDEISDAMILLATDKETCEKMGVAGKKRVAAFYDVNIMRAKYNNLYEDIYDKTFNN